MNTFKIDTDELTVYAIDKYGEHFDLNAEGDEINSQNELVEFINELHQQKFFDADTRDDLMDQI